LHEGTSETHQTDLGRAVRIVRPLTALFLTSLFAAGAALPAPAQEPAPTTEAPTRSVSLLIYVVDIVEISGSDQSVLADVFVRARWHDPEQAGLSEQTRVLGRGDAWRPEVTILNQRSVSQSLPEVIRANPDGSMEYVQRFTGRFSAFMDLRDFPLDQQQVEVWVVAPRLAGPVVELELEPDVQILMNDRLSISDWIVSDPRLGLEAFSATPAAVPISGMKLTVQAQRRVGYYVIQVLIPLTAIVFMAWTVFWIAPTVIPTRVGVVVTTMLTLIAYRFMLGNLVPRLSYLTRLDYFMLGATSLVILVLFTMAGTAYLVSRERMEAVRRIDRAGRWLYPLAFVLLSFSVWLR
jgi:hypothetical protein